MTTPTREQVEQLSWKHWHMDEWSYEYFDAYAFYQEARADLEATIAEQAAEIERLEAVSEVKSDEYKTWWELALHVGAWKNHELDYVHFGSEMAVRAFAIHLLSQRDKYETELHQQLTEQQAYIERLKHTLDQWLLVTVNDRTEYAGDRAITRAELAIPSSTEALREHDARLVESLLAQPCIDAQMLREIADKIRKGEF